MHKLLRRQLKRLPGIAHLETDETRALLSAIDDAYSQADHDRLLLERSLDLTSQELLEANSILRRDREQLESLVRERTRELTRLNESLAGEVAERRQAEVAIRQSEEKHRRLFEESRDVIYISTGSGRLIDINPAGVKLFGYESKEELLQIDIERDLYARAEDRAQFARAMEEAGFVRDLEVMTKCKDGSVITVQVSATAERDDDGRVRTYRGTLRDVTERRELETRLQQAVRMEALGRLAGGVAHDFNNLLTAILGYAEILDRDRSLGAAGRAHVREIRSSALRGAELTSQLLAVSRRQVIRPRVIDLNSVVRGMQNLLLRVIGEDVNLESMLGMELGNVMADRGQLEQVILNLALNARDAMPHGGTLHISTQLATIRSSYAYGHLEMRAGRYVRLAIADTGVGIEDETRERIFEPFFTTKRSSKGSGMGLSMVYGIVEQSNGYIDVHSRMGEGSVFHIYLPVTDAPLDKEVRVQRPEPARGTETVLVVEDESSVRELIAGVLTAGGYQVLSAPNGRRALEIFEAEGDAIELLITDVIMPHMGGLELVREARARHPSLPVIVISGHADLAADALRSRRGADRLPFLQKPFSPHDLESKVRAVLDKPSSRTEPAR